MNFVTGGTGILGSQLITDLLLKGEKVRALKRKSSNLKPLKTLLKHYQISELYHQIEWVEFDLNHTGKMLEALQGVGRVFHCAALVSFDPRDKKLMDKINIEGTKNVVNTCLQAGVEELVFASSTAAIGKQKKGVTITEKMTWDAGARNSYYSFTKYVAELEVWRGQEEGLNVVVVNPSVIIGPGEWGKSSTSVFTTVFKGLKFYSTGGNAFVDVRDVSRAMLELSNKKIFNERFLLIAENLSFKKFMELIARVLHKNPPSIQSTRWMTSIAWRANWVFSLLSGKRPVITRDTARAAMSIQEYSNEKIKNALNFEFIPVQDAVERTGKMFLKDLGD